MSRSILILPESLSMGFVAAAVASIPAAVRVTEGSIDFLPAWFAVAGLLAVPFVASIGAARLARRWLGVVPPRARLGLALWALFWAALSVPLEAALGAVLKVSTHHRALGGTTFAAIALAINLAALVGSYRMTMVALPSAARHPKVTGWGVGIALVTGVLLLTVAAAGVVAADIPQDPRLAYYSGAVRLDAALAMIATTAGVLMDVSRPRGQALSWVAAGSLVALVAVGFASLVHWPRLAREVGNRAPLAGTFGQVFAAGPGPSLGPNRAAPVSAAADLPAPE